MRGRGSLREDQGAISSLWEKGIYFGDMRDEREIRFLVRGGALQHGTPSLWDLGSQLENLLHWTEQQR